MRLRDRVDIVSYPGSELIRADVPAWIGFQSTALAQDARLQTTEALRAILAPADADELQHENTAIRWQGTAYPVTGIMLRMKRGRPHHVTVELERVSG